MLTSTDTQTCGETRATRVRLTPREVEVIVLAAQGYRNADIAAELYLGVDTVKSHLKRAYGRLGARDRAHAIHLAHRLGITAVTGADLNALPSTQRRVRERVPATLVKVGMVYRAGGL